MAGIFVGVDGPDGRFYRRRCPMSAVSRAWLEPGQTAAARALALRLVGAGLGVHLALEVDRPAHALQECEAALDLLAGLTDAVSAVVVERGRS